MSLPKNHQFKHTNQERRSSVVYSNGKGALFNPQDFVSSPLASSPLMASPSEDTIPHQLVEEERSLLEDNHLIPQHKRRSFITMVRSSSEPNTSLDPIVSDEEVAENDVINAWEDAVSENKQINTNAKREATTLINNAVPLVFTFVLQNSLSLASIFSISHLGKNELGGITLGSMTANIFGFAAIQGLCTCLDTLCAQAYGAGNYQLVGLLFQRCVLLSLIAFVPVLYIWFAWSESLLQMFVPEPELCYLAARYLKVVMWGIPGFILFECGKRFLQCQGIFHASTIILLVCAPLNMVMNYVLVWDKTFGIGYLGAPIAVVINYWLMAIGLFIYTYFTKSEIDPRKCWDGLILKKPVEVMFKNADKMFALALPGIIMVEAEFLGFEILTIFASHLGTDELAAQSIIATVASLAYQVPFSISIATSTRVANFVGAGMAHNAKITCGVSLLLSVCIAFFNMCLIHYFRVDIAAMFSADESVVVLVASGLSVLAVMQLFDAFNASTSGCLRGQGQQKIGSMINVCAFYLVGIPLSWFLVFKHGWGVNGLWWGIMGGLSVMSFGGALAVWGCDWDRVLRQAQSRNAETAV